MEPEATRDIGDEIALDWEGGWMRRFAAMPAVAPHPVTGELLWTGYNPKFHWAGAFAQSLFDAAFHNRTPRQMLTTTILGILTGIFSLLRLLTRVPGFGIILPSFLASPGLSSTALA